MIFNINIKNKGTIDKYISGNISYTSNNASILQFTILDDSKYFNTLERFIDKVSVIDLEGNEIFDGRVLDIKRSMNSNGEFINHVTCESTLNYLVDITVPIWDLYPGDIPKTAPSHAEGNVTATMLLEKILNVYNSESLVKINLGNVTVNEYVRCKTNRQTCLAVIQESLIGNLGGYINIRKENDEYYLDYLSSYPVVLEKNNLNIGVNIQNISIDGNLKSICTKLIGLGANNKLEATATNENLVKKYGVIEKVVQYNGITIQEELQQRVNKDIETINTNILTASIGALDLSYINNDISSLKLYQNISINCPELNYNETHVIIDITLDLIKPYNSTFSLNTQNQSQTNQISEIIQENNNNKLEILEINGQLIEKVSNSEFSTYKDQTANEIESKVSSDDFSTLFNQNINGFDFTIGNNTPLEIEKNKLVMNFNSNERLVISKNGFSWDLNGKPFYYKSIVKTGTVFKVPSGKTVTINLPDEFKYKKSYEFIWWSGNVSLNSPQDLLYAANTIQVDGNKNECWFKLKADVMTRDPETQGSPVWSGALNIMWMAIG